MKDYLLRFSSMSVLISLVVISYWPVPLVAQEKNDAYNSSKEKTIEISPARQSVLSYDLLNLYLVHTAAESIKHADDRHLSLVYFGETNEELYVHIEIMVYDKSHLPKVNKALESISSKQVNYVPISPHLITAYVPVVKLSVLADLPDKVKLIRPVTKPVKRISKSNQLID